METGGGWGTLIWNPFWCRGFGLNHLDLNGFENVFNAVTLRSHLERLSEYVRISRDHWHKRRATGGKRKPLRKKRKFELGRPAANTKVSGWNSYSLVPKGSIQSGQGVAIKSSVLFDWIKAISPGVLNVVCLVGCFEVGCTRKTRIIDVVYNASNNELVRTKTLVKNAIVTIDATPFRQWYEAHYALPLGRKKGAKLTEADEAVLNKKRSKKVEKKYKARERLAKVEPALEEQFQASRVLACISSRPGQCGRADGYILEGKELEFYMRKIKAKKGK
ncbi:hypothetical protein Cfor_06613 [Coptotermes formosanus]|uniref:Small ribosomal subunit protein eS8 n=1 Tax=Coptotermes formosanus TaxID=36987 RepID=A0A6L2PI47_COPFO|nr:hypothetical protein Cfor_06613 [Coptotermes formosanus]